MCVRAGEWCVKLVLVAVNV